MAPSLDQLEARQLLSAAPVHSHAEALRHHRAALVEKAREAHHASAEVSPAMASPDAMPISAATTGFGVSPSPVVPNGDLTATTAIADNDIWAVGYNDMQTAPPAFNTTLAEHFNGTSWSVVPTPSVPSGGLNSPAAEFLGVAAVSSKDVWAVGLRTGPDNPDFGEQLIENWNGKAWSQVTSPEIEGAELTGVVAISANNVWAVGGGGVSSSPGPLIEHFNGTAWSVVPNTGALASTSSIGAVAVDPAGDIWTVGANGTANVLIEFNGTTWNQVAVLPEINGSRMGVASITAISSTDVWLAGSGFFERVRSGHKTETIDHPAVAQWNGTSLSVVPTPVPVTSGLETSSFTGIAAVSANDIVAVGVIGGSTIDDTTTLIEQWNGTSWSIVSSPNPSTGENDLSAVTALSDGTVVAVGTQTDNDTGESIPLILHS